MGLIKTKAAIYGLQTETQWTIGVKKVVASVFCGQELNSERWSA